jgi:ferrochelatase
VAQHLVAAGHVAAEVARRTGVERRWDLVYQSRSGPPGQPWLEPDVSDHLRTVAAEGVPAVVVVPIGFLGDHVEVLWDLDVVARDDAAALGLAWARAATVETEPRFVSMLADLVQEHAAPAAVVRPSVAPWGPMPGRCAIGCCPNPRGERPALCGEGDPS